MLSNGRLKLRFHDSAELTCVSTKSLKDRRWYRLTSILEESEGSLTCHLSVREKEYDEDTTSTTSLGFKNAPKCANDTILCNIHGPFALGYGGSLNGRLEDPSIKITMGDEEQFYAYWSTSYFHSPKDNGADVNPWIIPCSDGMLVTEQERKNGDALYAIYLHNHPTRGVKGRRWDGTEFCWKQSPKHYGAIHFHDDDIYNFQWKPTMDWKIPSGIPSGIYIMRFVTAMDDRGDEEQHEEALALFICAPKSSLPNSEDSPCTNKLVLLIPTFTYVMYGNHARPDFEKELWLTRTKKSSPGAYPYNPALFPVYGHSSYDFHSDGTGIHFASHLRPLFNLRPGYITFSRIGGFNEATMENNELSMCSGLRHLPADSHIVSWLHHCGYNFDVITDHELHREGIDALRQYSTLITCTHPEYHTPQSLEALQNFRDTRGGNLIYLGGNGFYWKIAASHSSCNLLEIRRSEGGVRTWAAEAGEYYNLLDGKYGGLWKNSNRPPSKLVGVSFAAQGSFVGKAYHRTCWDRPEITDWVFDGLSETAILGGFGFSGDGAAGYELDRIDPSEELFRDGEIVILAQADTASDPRYALVPEEVLTPWTNLAGTSNEEAKRADMVYFCVPKSGAKVFSVGSITFCGCLPYNNFDNSISQLVRNVVDHFLKDGDTRRKTGLIVSRS